MKKAVMGNEEMEYLILHNHFHNSVITMEVETLINMLQEKGIFTKDEFDAMREKTYNDLPEMSATIDDLYNILQALENEYKVPFPDMHLKDPGDKIIYPEFGGKNK